MIDLSASFSELQTELASSCFVADGDDVTDVVVDLSTSLFGVAVADGDVIVVDVDDVTRFSSSRFRDVSFKMEAPACFGLCPALPRLALKTTKKCSLEQ